MANDENKIILEFPATNVEIEFGETITFDNISGFLDSGRVTYNGESLTEEITHLEDGKADKDNTYTKTQVDSALNNKMDKANPTGTGRIAVGQGVVASGAGSQAFGVSSTASGLFSHAEGFVTTASGESSHAEGYLTTASGQYSHAEGCQTIASGRSQHVSGKYNVVDNNNTYAEIIGNGGSQYARSNARTLDWQGNEKIEGDLTFNGSTSLTAEIDRLDDKIDDLPKPMIFKGTLGTGGTIQSLPAADAAHEGYTYKVITEGTYAGQAAKIGDTFTCCKPEGAPAFTWVLFSQGDTDTDTWRNIKVNGTEVIGSGISSGAVDFIGSENIEIEYESTGNKIKAKTKNIYTKAEVDDLIEETVYDLLPSDTESGPIANFETDLALPLKSMEIEVEAQQEAGTPAPASPLPISGWNTIRLYQRGANLFDKTNVIDGYYINDVDGTQRQNTGDKCTDFIEIKPNTAYFIYSEQTTGRWGAWYDKDKNFISGITLYGVKTAPTNARYMRLTTVRNGNGNVDTFSINYPSSDTAFHAYEGTTEVIELGGTYYGGRLLQDKEGHRRFEVTHKIVDMGDFGWTMNESDSNKQRFITKPNDIKAIASNIVPNGLCNIAQPQTRDAQINSPTSNYWTFGITSGGYISFLTPPNEYTDATVFKNSVTGQKIVYELATPYTIDLPDGEPITTFIGTNNIYADSGDTTVEFKESINQKIASLQALLLST